MKKLKFKQLQFFALLIVSAICAADVQFPDTPAGRQATAWLQAFNSGDSKRLHDFLQKNLPDRAQHMEQEMSFRAMTGGFDVKKVEESTPTRLVALVQERNSDQMGRLLVGIDTADPHRLTLDLRAIPRPAEFPLPHLSEPELIGALRKKLNEDSTADRFCGAVLVAKNGKPVFAEAYGLADREHKLPNTLKTRFRIGSMNKMFTATSILQLAQAEKLGLDDPVGKYLADYPNKDVATKVTIRQLLTHTGGTGDIFGSEFEAHHLELRTLQDYIKLYGNRAPQFEPGNRWEYSNYGFILLGAIIEKVSGQTYYDYVREHVYGPAGMTASGSQPEDETVPGRSIGYTRMGGPDLRPNTDTLPYRGTSAGGGYSTVEDLLKFADALQDHKLLNAEFTDILTTGKVDAHGARYAFGFEDQVINAIRCFGHGGGAPGMNGDLEICPGPAYVIAVLSNMDPPAAGHVSSFITNRLPQAASAGSPQASDDLQKILARMDETAKTFHTAQSNFTWTQYNSVINDTTDKQHGRIYFRRAGSEIQMAADIAQPDPKQVIFSHGKIQIFQAKTGVVDVYDAGAHREEVESFLVLGFGAGGQDMLKSYEVKYLGTEVVDGRQAAKLDLTPKSAKIRQNISHLLLWIDPQTGISVQQQLFQSSGDYRLAKYSDIQLKSKISDTLFKLKTPSKVVNH